MPTLFKNTTAINLDLKIKNNHLVGKLSIKNNECNDYKEFNEKVQHGLTENINKEIMSFLIDNSQQELYAKNPIDLKINVNINHQRFGSYQNGNLTTHDYPLTFENACQQIMGAVKSLKDIEPVQKAQTRCSIS